MKKACLCLVVAAFLCAGHAAAQDSGILEPIKIFDQYYGTADMDRVADVVTSNFRDGKPKTLWVSETWQILQELGYERLGSEVLDTEVKGDVGLVRLRAKNQTAVGVVKQDEVFSLVKDGGIWLIDDLQIMNEELEAEKEEL